MAHPGSAVPFGGPSCDGGPEVTGPRGYARFDEFADWRCLCGHIAFPLGAPCPGAVAYDPPRCQCADHWPASLAKVKAGGGDQ